MGLRRLPSRGGAVVVAGRSGYLAHGRRLPSRGAAMTPPATWFFKGWSGTPSRSGADLGYSRGWSGCLRRVAADALAGRSDCFIGEEWLRWPRAAVTLERRDGHFSYLPFLEGVKRYAHAKRPSHCVLSRSGRLPSWERKGFPRGTLRREEWLRGSCAAFTLERCGGDPP